MSKWERGGVRDRVRVSENGHGRQKNRDRESERGMVERGGRGRKRAEKRDRLMLRFLSC